MAYCIDIPGVMNDLVDKYQVNEWRLFIDSCRRSLKGVLLHNSNRLASVPVAHFVKLKETYENLKQLLINVKYSEHNWMICGDLKVIGILLGQERGNTKYPCYICKWDSRDRINHWIRQE